MPYRVVGGLRFYERQEIRDAVAYMRVLQLAGGRPGVRADHQPAAPRRGGCGAAGDARGGAGGAHPLYEAAERVTRDGTLKGKAAARRCATLLDQLRPLARAMLGATATW